LRIGDERVIGRGVGRCAFGSKEPDRRKSKVRELDGKGPDVKKIHDTFGEVLETDR
jgi:hypothetical protein